MRAAAQDQRTCRQIAHGAVRGESAVTRCAKRNVSRLDMKTSRLVANWGCIFCLDVARDSKIHYAHRFRT
jgi:hypothetical protein